MQTTESRPDWIQCIEQAHGRSWCGQQITSFHFTDLDHAAQTGLVGGRLVACTQCVDAAMKVLRAGAPAMPQPQPTTDYRVMWIEAEQRAVRLADALNGTIPVKPEQVQAWLCTAIESATKCEAAAFRKGVEAALRQVRAGAKAMDA